MGFEYLSDRPKIQNLKSKIQKVSDRPPLLNPQALNLPIQPQPLNREAQHLIADLPILTVEIQPVILSL